MDEANPKEIALEKFGLTREQIARVFELIGGEPLRVYPDAKNCMLENPKGLIASLSWDDYVSINPRSLIRTNRRRLRLRLQKLKPKVYVRNGKDVGKDKNIVISDEPVT